jgi:NADH:ubiquinone oxidoreductase subunit H
MWFLYLYKTGGNSWYLGLKTILVMYFIVWARAALPRYRYDQLMKTQ